MVAVSGDWVYVSGPVTGVPNGNRLAFAEAARRLEEAGFRPVDPTGIVPGGAPWERAMRTCISLLAASDGLAFLPGSTCSRGASLEMRVADELGMRVASVDEWCAGAGGAE